MPSAAACAAGALREHRRAHVVCRARAPRGGPRSQRTSKGLCVGSRRPRRLGGKLAATDLQLSDTPFASFEPTDADAARLDTVPAIALRRCPLESRLIMVLISITSRPSIPHYEWPEGIPKVIHFCYKHENIPGFVKDTWLALNPGFKLTVHGDAACHAFLLAHYGSEVAGSKRAEIHTDRIPTLVCAPWPHR